jgi:predicted rRNA methylase YqxC with S4 and FtsJ domains
LSEDDRQLLQQLKEILKEKKELRAEIKNQLEVYRKAVHKSGLDIEQSLSYNAQIAAENERLDKINQGIREIESKIDEIERV